MEITINMQYELRDDTSKVMDNESVAISQTLLNEDVSATKLFECFDRFLAGVGFSADAIYKSHQEFSKER